MSTTTTTGPSTGHTSDFHHTTHDNQVVALFATDGEAQAAKASLISHGLPASAIQVEYRGDEVSAVPVKESSGFWGAIGSLFAPDEDRNSFTHAVSHGHALLLVTPPEGADRHMVIQTLEAAHPVDFDAKLEEWKLAGYDYSAPHEHYAAASQPAGGAAPTGFASGTGSVEPGTGNTGPLGGSIKGDVMGGATGEAKPSAPPAAATNAPGDAMAGARTGQRESVTGASRVRSYTAPRVPTHGTSGSQSADAEPVVGALPVGQP